MTTENNDAETTDVIVAAINKRTKEIETYTICPKEDSQRYAKYYRGIGYSAKVLSMEQFDEYYDNQLRNAAKYM